MYTWQQLLADTDRKIRSRKIQFTWLIILGIPLLVAWCYFLAKLMGANGVLGKVVFFLSLPIFGCYLYLGILLEREKYLRATKVYLDAMSASQPKPPAEDFSHPVHEAEGAILDRSPYHD